MTVRIACLFLGAVLLAGCAAATAPTSTGAPPSPAGPVVTAADAVERVIAENPQFTGIAARDPNLIGQANWYEVMPASGVGAFIVTMRIGWGDCPAGCIDEHSWTYAVGPSGTVTLQSEAGSPVPSDAWPSQPADSPGGTGIRITAVAGPVCPVERFPPDPACAPKPVPNATILIADASGRDQGMVTTDASGQTFAGLAPGQYTVTAQGAAGFMNGPEPQQVTVEDGQVTDVTLSYDTGIR